MMNLNPEAGLQVVFLVAAFVVPTAIILLRISKKREGRRNEAR